MASPNISAILFDVGGVVLTNGWDHNERAAVLRQFNLDREAFEARHEKPNDAWERDSIDIYQYLDATVFYESRSFTPDQFIEAMKAQSTPLQPSNAMPVVRDLAAAGKWLVGLLNNESRALHEYRMQKFGLNQYLEVQFSSCYLAMRKPDAEFYRRALDILALPGNQIVFIDDRKGNTDAAAAVGMHAIQFQSEDQLRSDLHQVGVL